MSVIDTAARLHLHKGYARRPDLLREPGNGSAWYYGTAGPRPVTEPTITLNMPWFGTAVISLLFWPHDWQLGTGTSAHPQHARGFVASSFCRPWAGRGASCSRFVFFKHLDSHSGC